MDRASVRLVAALVALKVLVHLAVITRYGFHGDELYFIECGRHLAFGYVDHPPLIPWIARITDELGGGIVLLRLPAVAAGAGTMVVASLLVHEWGGGWRAQLVALLSLAVGPAHLRVGAMLNIPVIEIFFCTLTAYLVVRALSREERWTWVLAGLSLGLAILAKHSSAIWAAALAVGILVTPHRRVLATRWPWIGFALAAAMNVPNVVWQMNHDFATLEFLRTLRREVVMTQGRLLFVAGQVLYYHPLVIPVWVSGLVFGLRRRGDTSYIFAVLFIAMFAFLLASGGKPYYLGSAYPAVLAAGGVALEGWAKERSLAWRTLVASIGITGGSFAIATLPLLPLPTVDKTMAALFGWAVPPFALTHDLHGMYGWEAHAKVIDDVLASLPESERSTASVLAGSYSQASAVNVLRKDPTPRAVSGNMNYYLWGPEPGRGETLIAYGVSRNLLDRHYRACTEVTRVDAPLARPYDTDLPVYVCRDPVGTMNGWWPEVKRFGHLPTNSETGGQP
ncbi:MAG: glycosyltransferase family 39 protein [Polyangiaceae bacterium]|nr:glycosyltransferase family 39 protein [Polyangiaceae bacterium]